MRVLILAGGFGTRLNGLLGDIPKPMASIAGKPFLEHQINFLKHQGLEEILLGVHYGASKIKSYFQGGMRLGVRISYSEEEVPLGTAGAIKFAQKHLEENPFFVLNGDSYSDVNLSSFLDFHNSNTSGIGSILLKRSSKGIHYGSVLMKNDQISNFIEKSESQCSLINRGIYIFNPEIFDLIPNKRKVSLEEDIFPKLAKTEKLFGQIQEGYFMDLGRPETYMQFKEDFFRRIMSSKDISVRQALGKIRENSTDLLLVTNEDRKLLGVVNYAIISRFIESGGDPNNKVSKAMVDDPYIVGSTSQSEEEILNLLESGTRHIPILDNLGRVQDIRFRDEESKKGEFPTISGKAPLRISFSGGGTDLSYFFEKHGGAVINTTINKYCYATAKRRADQKLVIDSDVIEDSLILDTRDLIYKGILDIPKAIWKIIKPGFGADLYLHNDLPPGRGLGSSASLSTLLIKITGELSGKRYDEEAIAEIAYKVETKELGILGGKQDQYAVAYGGFNWIEFDSGDKKIMHTLVLGIDRRNELRDHLILCYTGSTHDSGNQHKKQKESFERNEEKNTQKLLAIKRNAIEFKKSLLSSRPDFEAMGRLLHGSWENKRELSKYMSNSQIDLLYDIGIQNGIYGGKLLGSGGGGYLLMLYPPKRRNSLVRALKENGERY